MMWACIACAVGRALAWASLLVMVAADKPPRPWLAGTLILTFVVGFVGCSVEGRVCELAREASP